jgi:hypothetical protein
MRSRATDLAGFDAKDLAIIGGVAAVIYLIWKNGVAGAAQKLTSAAGDAIIGAGSGVVSSIGKGVGLPGYEDITTDPRVARWIVDSPRGGYLQASLYSTPVALASAIGMPVGSGIAPPQGTKIAEMFPQYVVDIGGTTDVPF